jgi:hypothetical protein
VRRGTVVTNKARSGECNFHCGTGCTADAASGSAFAIVLPSICFRGLKTCRPQWAWGVRLSGIRTLWRFVSSKSVRCEPINRAPRIINTRIGTTVSQDNEWWLTLDISVPCIDHLVRPQQVLRPERRWDRMGKCMCPVPPCDFATGWDDGVRSARCPVTVL